MLRNRTPALSMPPILWMAMLAVPAVAQVPDTGPLKVYILAGQSNMEATEIAKSCAKANEDTMGCI